MLQRRKNLRKEKGAPQLCTPPGARLEMVRNHAEDNELSPMTALWRYVAKSMYAYIGRVKGRGTGTAQSQKRMHGATRAEGSSTVMYAATAPRIDEVTKALTPVEHHIGCCRVMHRRTAIREQHKSNGWTTRAFLVQAYRGRT